MDKKDRVRIHFPDEMEYQNSEQFKTYELFISGVSYLDQIYLFLEFPI